MNQVSLDVTPTKCVALFPTFSDVLMPKGTPSMRFVRSSYLKGSAFSWKGSDMESEPNLFKSGLCMLIAGGEPARCSVGQFQCSSGECIDAGLQCDGRNDCRDRSDEHGCSECARCWGWTNPQPSYKQIPPSLIAAFLPCFKL